MRHIYKCPSCIKYTMKESCICGAKTSPARPLKYSHEDKYARYKRKAMLGEYSKRELI